MCRSEYRGGFRERVVDVTRTDSVRTNLAGSVGVKTEIWEFKYHFCSILMPGEQTPPQRHTSKAGRELPRNDSRHAVLQ